MLKKATRVILIAILTLCTYTSYGQGIQWAAGIDFQYNQYAKEGPYSGGKLLGKPDALLGKLSTAAFRLKNEMTLGTFILNYKYPQHVQKVIIIESYLPGRIKQIILYDEEGNKYPIFKNKTSSTEETHRALILALPRTEYKVQKIEIQLSSITHNGWPQIDAVGISLDLTSSQITQMLGSRYNIHEEMSFSAKKENMGNMINTRYTETKPIISPDGKTLYFSRQEYPGNMEGKDDLQDIYVSYFNPRYKRWSEAENIEGPLNNKWPNGVSSVTPDGNTLLLIGAYRTDNVFKNGASVSYRTRNGWSFPRKLDIDDFYNTSRFVDYYLSNNKKVLLMALEREDSYGDLDLYVSFIKPDQTWTAPKNLGPNVNSDQAEFSPFLAADGKTLYFSSEGHDNYGKSDIFYTKRSIPDSWEDWSKAQNLGTAINTEHNEAYYTISASGDFAYYVSNQDSYNNSKDIFRIPLPKEFKPEPVLLMMGKVINQKTGLPIEAEVVFESLPEGIEEGIARADADGNYKIILPQGKNYAYRAKARGYMAVNKSIDLTEINRYTEIEQDLILVPIEVGQIVQMNNIFFVRGKTSLLPESMPELNRLVEFLEENPTIVIELGGHTDNRGNFKLNYELSRKRVEAIKAILVTKKIDKKRLIIRAYGGTKPIASNASEKTRKLNRRVEIKILSF